MYTTLLCMTSLFVPRETSLDLCTIFYSLVDRYGMLFYRFLLRVEGRSYGNAAKILDTIQTIAIVWISSNFVWAIGTIENFCKRSNGNRFQAICCYLHPAIVNWFQQNHTTKTQESGMIGWCL